MDGSDAVEEGTRRGRSTTTTRWTGWNWNQANGLTWEVLEDVGVVVAVGHTLCVCSVELSDCCLCILGGFVRNVCDTLGATSTIVGKGELQNWSNAIEEVLLY